LFSLDNRLPPVTLQYDTTMHDVDAWYGQYLKLPQVASRLRGQSFYTALCTGAIGAVLMLALGKDLTAAGIAGALVFLVVWALMGAGIRGEILKRAKRAVVSDPTTPALGAHTLEITPTELIETCSHHKLSTRWDAVERLVQTDKHVFILLRGHTAVIVPVRIFSSEATRDDFVRRVEELISAHAATASNRAI
jgi:hypothetical protein